MKSKTTVARPKLSRRMTKQANNTTLQADALEITLRAERRLGQLLAENPLNKGGRPITTTKVEGVSTPTLKAIGIDWKLSARSQKIAKIEDEFE